MASGAIPPVVDTTKGEKFAFSYVGISSSSLLRDIGTYLIVVSLH